MELLSVLLSGFLIIVAILFLFDLLKLIKRLIIVLDIYIDKNKDNKKS